jgi:hypothetical protein
MNNFAEGLRQAITDNPDHEPAIAARVVAVLNGPDSLRQRLLLRRMETRVCIGMGYGGTAAFDWSKVDWAAVLGMVLKMLLIILPLI